MSGLPFDLVPIWVIIIGLSVFLYVLLDGFDLGVGILYGIAPAAYRSQLMNSIAPVWDGNETWLILGGVALYAIFPLAFAVIIPAVYFPIALMLLALVFRGVSFEFRFEQPWLTRFWSTGFCFGSLLASFAQGVVLGTFIQGMPVHDRAFAGSSWDWLNPFSIVTGVALVAGYALLGASWLIIKAEGDLNNWARTMARRFLLLVLLAIVVVSIWTPVMDPVIARRWFGWPNIAWLVPIPTATALLAWACWWAIDDRDSEAGPFLAAMGIFITSYLGVAISLWPMIVPHSLSLWEATSAPSTQAFLLIGTLLLLPIILMYTAWSYWVFRGKLRDGVGYH